MRSRLCAGMYWFVSVARHRAAEPQGRALFQRSLSALYRLAGLAQAARPLAGGSPNHVRGLALRHGSIGCPAHALTPRLARVHASQPGLGSVAQSCVPLVPVPASTPWLGHISFASQLGRLRRCGLTLTGSNVKALCNRELEHVQGLGLVVRAWLSAKARSGRPSFCGLLTARCSRSLRPRRGISLFLALSPGWSKLEGSTAECSRNYLEFLVHSGLHSIHRAPIRDAA
jgi:hypothetical protein